MDTAEISEEGALRNQFTVDDLDIEILPLIYEIIRSVEKDPHDTSQKAKESQDTSHKILELQKKLDSARAQIKRLPGIEYSKEEQLQKLETLRKQLRLKRELLLKYRNMCSFEFMNSERVVQRLSESRPIRRAAQVVASAIIRSKEIGFKDMNKTERPGPFAALRRFLARFKEEVKQAKDEAKNK